MPEEITQEMKDQLATQQAIADQQPKQFASWEQFLESEKAKEAAEKAEIEKQEKEGKQPDKKAKAAADADKVTQLLADRLGFRRDKKEDKKADVKPDAEKKGDDNADVSDKAEDTTEEETKGKKVTVRRREPAPDPEEVATVAATAAAKTVEKALEHLKPTPPQKADPLAEIESGLSDEEKEEYVVFKKMAEENPAQKDLPRQYLQMVNKISKYQEKWERDNPGESFDPNSADHDEFFASVTPSYSDREFRKAEAKLAAEELVKAQEAKNAKRDEERDQKDSARDLNPIVQQTKLMAVRDIVQGFGKDYDKLIEEKGFNAFVEADPLAARVLSHTATKLEPFLEAARQIDQPGSKIKVDPQNNPAHREYLDYLMATELAVKEGPAKERIRDGKRFATRREMANMPPAQRSRYWFLNDDDLIARRIAEETENALEIYNKEVELSEKIAISRGYKKDGSATQQTQTTQQRTPKKPDNTAAVRGVESQGSNRVDTSGASQNSNEGDVMSSINKILFPS